MRSCASNCCLGLALSLMVSGVVLALVFLGPAYLFRPSPDLKVGFIVPQGRGQGQEAFPRVERAAKMAIADIENSIDGMKQFDPKPPRITMEIPDESEVKGQPWWKGQFEELRGRGVEHFFGLSLSDSDMIDFGLHMKENCQDCLLLSPTLRSRPQSLQESVLATNFDNDILAKAFAEVISEGNPYGKLLYIIPVVRVEPATMEFYESFLRAVTNDHPHLRLTSPVTYEPSNYPGSDAIQVISDIGTRLGLVPRAQVFFISSQDLVHILKAVHLNKALLKRRWYAKDVAYVEDDLRANDLSDLCQKVSLTTVTFLGDGESEWNLALRDSALKRHLPEAQLSLYQEALAYESVMLLHRIFTKYAYHGLGRQMSALSEEGPFSFLNNKRTSGLLLSQVFNGESSKAVRTLPDTKWIPERKIKAIDNGKIMSEPVKSHPLLKEEVKRILREGKKSFSCNPKTVLIRMPPTLLTPSKKYSFLIQDLPKSLIIPMEDNIQVDFLCKSRKQNQKRPFSYFCTPGLDDTLNLTCMTSTPTNSRSKRSVKKKEDNKLKGIFNKALEDYESLLPSFISCSSSIAGCDFCFYFLATYNISASPAACIGGCSLGTFGSCSKLVAASFSKSMNWS